MFNFLRFHILILSFCFIFFGANAVSFAGENSGSYFAQLNAHGSSPIELAAKKPDLFQSVKMKFATVAMTPTAYADEGQAPQPVEKSDLDKIVEALGGLKGGGALAIALVIVQLLMLIAKAVYKPTAGWQLTLVLGFSVVAGVLSAMVIGKMDFGAALMSSGVLAAIQVFFNQAFKKATA